MGECPPQVDDWSCGIDWYACKKREVLAAVGVGTQMRNRGMGEKNER